MAHVYKLVWPGKEGVYVGCSTQVENRHYSHKVNPQTRVLFLMQELYGDPEIEVLEEVPNDADMLMREAYWIIELDALDGDKGGLNATENIHCAYWAGHFGLTSWFEDKQERQESRKRLETKLSEKLGELLGPHKDRVAGFWKDAKKLDAALEKRKEDLRLQELNSLLKAPSLRKVVDPQLGGPALDFQAEQARLARRRALAQSLVEAALKAGLELPGL